ncbi:MAG: alpha-glucan phosphorylase, partial [Lentisphaerae bacterium RIFOXYA12_FULL_48_11]
MYVKTFTVLPDTPEKLKHLNDLAYNLWFSWNPAALKLFEELDKTSWEEASQNPVRMLCIVPQEKLEAAAKNYHYLAELASIYDSFKLYMDETTWFEKQFGKRNTTTIAYFSCEFGLHECLPVYSGGLGILAGDYMKSASDLGLPMVGVGLLYQQGYARQYLNAEGVQQELYPENDWYSMPVELVRNADGKPVIESVKLGKNSLYFQIWKVNVGRIKIYLLDTNIENNAPAYRATTTRLYDSDRNTRIHQEILLGIGGVKALKAVGLDPQVFHVNEGHSAFLLLERIRNLMHEKKLTFDEAREIVWATTVFTTHTPVDAGNERFDTDLMTKHFTEYIRELGLKWDDFMALGRENPDNPNEEFCMTVLALKLSAFSNGVSKLHGRVSRKMWHKLYPSVPENERPIISVTNGIHVQSWLNPALHELLGEGAGTSDNGELPDAAMWQKVDRINDEVLWKSQNANRQILVEFIREHARWQLARRGAGAAEMNRTKDIFDPKILTIGFARRFASYKRGNLFLRNPERLRKILADPKRPVQIVVAGKAHPADHNGKELIKQIFEYSKLPDFMDRIIFLEDYDIKVAKHLVQGVDVWLNTPRRLMEASGTSGMKAAINGTINLSILDGWWDEAYTPEVGFAIGHGEDYNEGDTQDSIESDLLYGALEKEIVPMFYDRDEKGIPRQWVKMMKNSIKMLGPEYNTHRMA